MARSIQECNRVFLPVFRDVFGLICSHMLGDAAGFTGDHVGLADIVEQSRFAMVNVAHDDDHRRADNQIVLAFGHSRKGFVF